MYLSVFPIFSDVRSSQAHAVSDPSQFIHLNFSTAVLWFALLLQRQQRRFVQGRAKINNSSGLVVVSVQLQAFCV
jgi:hypothetical protein